MPQPSAPPNRFPMVGEDGRPTLSWAQWFSAFWSALTSRVFYIPTSSGAPTFTPESRPGFVAMAYDTANNNLYVYNGAWKKVTLS